MRNRLERVIAAFIAIVFVGFAVVSIDVNSAEQAAISLSWDQPTEREDGSELALEEIVGYRIYIAWNGVEVAEPVEVAVDRLSYDVPVQAVGKYTFWISTVASNGLGDSIEGRRSDPLFVDLDLLESDPLPPAGLIGALSGCVSCGLIQEGAN